MSIQVEVNENQLKYVQRELGKMKDKAPVVIKNAVNRAARKARKQFHEEIRNNYTVNQAGFNSRIQLVLAKPGRLYAIVKSEDRTLTVPRFKHMTSKKAGASVDVTGHGYKKLVITEGGKEIKAFKNGKLVMQRKTQNRYPLKVLRSNSVPKMVEMTYKGGGNIRQALEPIIAKTLKEEINIGIAKMLEGK